MPVQTPVFLRNPGFPINPGLRARSPVLTLIDLLVLPALAMASGPARPSSCSSLSSKYDFLCRIGEGGYGFVCEALDKTSQTHVAIKVINLDDVSDEVESVHREIRIMSNISCAQLVSYYESYEMDRRLFIVMEYLEAGSLLDIIKLTGPLLENYIAYIMHELLLALEYLHRSLKIHRDVKAGNLLVGKDGRCEWICVIQLLIYM
jgi:serine/threonine protein kinase